MAKQGYKKYMKKSSIKDYNLLKIFIISFFGMLLLFTFLIKSFTPTVDVSIGGDYDKEETENFEDMKKIVDDRLAMIQDEDQGRNFSELMAKAKTEEEQQSKNNLDKSALSKANEKLTEEAETSKDDEETKVQPIVQQEPVYKVFIGNYTSAEQAKVAKDIIIESGSNLSPIVKCIGSNNYTLQVGIFKSKTSAEALLYTIRQNHLPGRIVQDY